MVAFIGVFSHNVNRFVAAGSSPVSARRRSGFLPVRDLGGGGAPMQDDRKEGGAGMSESKGAARGSGGEGSAPMAPAPADRSPSSAPAGGAAEVFVTAGTDHHPFDRLVDMVEAWASARRAAGRPVNVFFQYGTSRPPAGHRSAPYLEYGDMLSRMRAAAAIVTHGGPATIMDARAAGRIPIVVPRRRELGEHVDNHQVRFAALLDERGEVCLSRDADHLGALLEGALADPARFAIREAAAEQLRESSARIGALIEAALSEGLRPHRRRLGQRFRRPAAERRKVLLACSTGGHLAQLLRLDHWWSRHDPVWVTFDKVDARSLLAGQKTVWAHHPTTRNIPNLARNLALAWRVLRRERFDVIVSDGAGVAVPFFWLSRLFGIVTVYIEVYDRIDLATVTGRLCQPVTDLFLLQWPEQRAQYPHGVVVGKLL
jgi:UDP-N-acetylglucosamine transferase subunit ALG13